MVRLYTHHSDLTNQVLKAYEVNKLCQLSPRCVTLIIQLLHTLHLLPDHALRSHETFSSSDFLNALHMVLHLSIEMDKLLIRTDREVPYLQDHKGSPVRTDINMQNGIYYYEWRTIFISSKSLQNYITLLRL